VKILVADDDRSIGLALQMALEDLGHECVVAEDGRTAWSLYQEQGADAIISDWRMPGFQGPELCRMVRAAEDRPYVYFLLLTVLNEPHRVLEGMEAGADDFLTKPFTIDALRARLIAAERVSILHRDLSEHIAETTRAAEERGRLLAQLEHEHGRLQAVIQQMPAGVIIAAAPTGDIIMVNDRVGEILQTDLRQPDGVVHLRLSARRPDGTMYAADEWPLTRSISTGEVVNGEEIVNTRPDGITGTLRVSSAPIYRGQLIEAAVVILQDVTEERRRQQEATQSDKLRALGQLAGGVAHDLNQYLTLVAGYADIGLATLDDDKAPSLTELRDMLRIMSQAAYDGGETVKRLLTFGRTDAEVATETIGVATLLHEVARLTTPRWRDAAQAQGRPIRLTVDAPPDIFIDGWPPSLREALTNLVFNAIDALPDGGTIELRARAEAASIVVDVVDSGTGIPRNVQQRIFEPFFTTKGAHGTGLGLPMVFGIITRLRGDIEVLSALGQGTTIRLRFPSTLDVAAPPAQAAGAASPQSRQILVVDDEPAIRHMVARVLEYDGHVVSTVGSAEAALERLQTETFDILISDIGLGAGMNGWQLIDHAHAAYPAMHLILASGWGAEIDSEAAAARGVGGILAKPYRFNELKRLIAASTPETG